MVTRCYNSWVLVLRCSSLFIQSSVMGIWVASRFPLLCTVLLWIFICMGILRHTPVTHGQAFSEPRSGTAMSQGLWTLTLSRLSLPESTYSAPGSVVYERSCGCIWSTLGIVKLDFCRQKRHTMITNCGLHVHLHDHQWMWTSFHVYTGPVYWLFRQMSAYSHCHFFYWVFGGLFIDSSFWHFFFLF